MPQQKLVYGPTGSGKNHYVEELIENNDWNEHYISDDSISDFDVRSAITQSIGSEKAIIFDNYGNYDRTDKKKVKEAVESSNHNIFVLTKDKDDVNKTTAKHLKEKDVRKSQEDIINILEEQEVQRDVNKKDLKKIAKEADGNVAFAIAKLRNPNIELNQEEELGIFTKLGLINTKKPVSEVIEEISDIHEKAFINWLEGTYVPKVRHKKKKQFYMKVLNENSKILFSTDSDYFYASLIYGTRALNERFRWSYPSKSENHQKDQIIKKLSEYHGWSEREARRNYSYFRKLIQNDQEFRNEMIQELELSESDCDYLNIEYKEFNEEEEVIEEDTGQQAKGLMDY